jgi:3-deoxy-D-manno-octulosonate 8-phosphate phosphatase (KDO 8-P phosphatase)
MDVDGTLTDGTLFLSGEDLELKAFHSKDGAGIRFLQEVGVTPVFISGRRSSATQRRARELDVAEVHLGIADKRACLEEVCRRAGVSLAEAAFVGDDLGDIPAMRACGFSAAPADAAPETRSAATFVTRTPGGRGAVREVIEHVLRRDGRWDEVLGRHGAAGVAP